MPTPLPTRRPLFPSDPPRRGGHRRLAIYLAVGAALVFFPLTLYYQNQRVQALRARREALHPTPTPRVKTIEESGDMSLPAELRQWHMDDVDGMSEAQARKRFGNPILSRGYNVTYGAFFGPKYGLKHYYLNSSPGFEQRERDAKVAWNFPQMSMVREMIWKLHESYLTLWLFQPPVEINLTGEDAATAFPRSGAGTWVVMDNYRVGQDLVKNPPVAATPSAAP